MLKSLLFAAAVSVAVANAENYIITTERAVYAYNDVPAQINIGDSVRIDCLLRVF
jgi:hypothetical protein